MSEFVEGDENESGHHHGRAEADDWLHLGIAGAPNVVHQKIGGDESLGKEGCNRPGIEGRIPHRESEDEAADEQGLDTIGGGRAPQVVALHCHHAGEHHEEA